MKIAGIIKSSLIEYPGKASTVIFFGGCNFRCGYCHNPELVFAEAPAILTEDFFVFLKKRRRFIDAVCVSGGEPTLQPELPDLLRRIKENDVAVKLDTNGTNPQMLRALLADRLVDFVAMDIKGPSGKYETIVGQPVDLAAIRESAELLSEAFEKGEITCEFRTTVCRELLSREDIRKMISEYKKAPNWFLQTFKNPGAILDSEGSYSAYTAEEMQSMGDEFCVSVR
jgi:pyruvate formate lyase activating enzyme